MHLKMKLFAWTSLLVPVLVACPGKPDAPPSPASVKRFTVEPSSLSGPGTVTLTWDAAGVEKVSVTTLEGVAVNLGDAARTSGTATVEVSTSTVFVLNAQGAGGSDKALASVAVTSAPSDVLFTSVASELEAGGETTLVWNVPGADSVTITDGASPIHAAAGSYGSLTVRPAFSTTYVLTAGGRTAERTIRVTPAILEFAAAEPAVSAGGMAFLLWKAGGAEKLSVSASGRGEVFSTTSRQEIQDGTFVDPLPAVVPSNGVIEYVLTAQSGARSVQRSVSVYVDDRPHIVVFKAPAYAKQGAAFSISWVTAQAAQVEIAQDGVVVHRALSQAEVNAGALTLPTPSTDVELELRVRGQLGGVVSEKKLVSPVGITSITDFTANAPVVAAGGDPVTLSWTAPEARHVELRENGRLISTFDGPAAAQGSVEAYPNKLCQYELRADNTLGDAAARTLSVDVTAPAKLLFDLASAPLRASVRITGTTVANGGALSGLPLVNDAADAFVDISATGTNIAYSGSDSALKAVRLPEVFSTTLFGTAVADDWISISPNGWMVFGTQPFDFQDAPTNAPLESFLPPLAMAPLYSDLFMSTGAIYYRIDTVGAQKRLIVQWDGVEHQWTNTGALTFQVQVYSNGRVVFAYDDLGNGFGTEPVLVGRVNADATGSESFYRAVVTGDRIAWGLELTPPIAFEAHDVPFTAIQKIGSGTILFETRYPIIAPGQVVISEVNAAPAVSGGQWFEIENRTANPFDLGGWELDFGNGNAHAIAPNTVIPANGRLVFAGTANAGDSVAVGYVYPAALTIVPGGSLALKVVGANYDVLSVPANLIPGTSWQVGPVDPSATAAAGVTELACAAHQASGYGTHGQRGTPGAPNTTCPEYALSTSGTSNFESIATTGTQLAFADGDEDVLELTLPSPLRVHGRTYGTVYVGTNGFLSLEPVACDFGTDTLCFWDNKSAPSQVTPAGVIAPYWDDLDTSTGGVYFQRKVPGVTPNDGYTIVSWENVAEYGNPAAALNFQVKFFDSGVIEFHTGTFANETPDSATVWLEDASGKAAYVLGANTPVAGGVAQRAFSFTPK